MKRLLLFIVGLAISLGAIYYLGRGDINTLQTEIEGGRYEYILPVLVVYFLGFVTRAYRWRALLSHRTTNWHAFHIMMVGYMFSLLPLRVGELARAWMTTRLDPPIQFFTSLSSIVIERVLDLLAVMVMLGFALVMLPVPREVSITGATLGTITLVMAAVMVYFAHNRAVAHRILEFILRLLPFLKRLNLVAWLDHALDGLQPLTNWRTTAEAVGWTLISWFLSVAAGYIIMLVFFDSADWAAISLMLVLLALAVAIPSVPGNLGTFEAAGVAGLYFAGIIASTEAPDNVPAVALSVLLHIINLGSYILFGMLGLYMEQTSLSQVRAGVGQLNEQAVETI